MNKECWCGSNKIMEFSEHYDHCSSCHTLISRRRKENDFYDVSDDEQSFYGKKYWLEHQKTDYGFDDIVQRLRSDLSERTLFWLNKILLYKLPPCKTIELGCGPGSLVFLMQTVGYDATGTELSSYIADYVSKTFKVPILTGKIEDLALGNNKYDIVIIMDVLEHFTDPLKSLKEITKVLSDDAILIIQTPRYQGQSYHELKTQKDPFLLQLKEKEHLFLFTEDGVAQILHNVGLSYIQKEEVFFPYDMLIFASKKPIKKIDQQQIENYLYSTPERRVIQGMLDLYHKWQVALTNAEARGEQVLVLEKLLRESETDRANRLKSIEKLEKLLRESETDRANRLKSIEKLEKVLRESETDRANRLKSIEKLEKLLRESENDRANRLKSIEKLEKVLRESETDRANRLKSIEKLEKVIKESESTQTNRLKPIEKLERLLKIRKND